MLSHRSKQAGGYHCIVFDYCEEFRGVNTQEYAVLDINKVEKTKLVLNNRKLAGDERCCTA